MHKQLLRKKLLAIRRSMTAGSVSQDSSRITSRVLTNVEWGNIGSLHTYLPLKSEPDTRQLLHTLWKKYPHIKTAGWKTTNNEHEAWWINSNGFTDKVPANFTYDVIIVPLLGFNDAYFRIGRGGGFYDRFLLPQPQALTIGLCYEYGYRPDFQPENHDIALKHIATEQRWR